MCLPVTMRKVFQITCMRSLSSRRWYHCRPLTEEDFSSLFSVFALELYNHLSGHKQQASGIASIPRKRESLLHIEACVHGKDKDAIDAIFLSWQH